MHALRRAVWLPLAALILTSCAAQPHAQREGVVAPIAREADRARTASASDRTTPNITVAFSPNGGATQAVVDAIGEAQHSVRMGAYFFTSKPIAQALVEAHLRGVQVRVILDKSQATHSYSGATFLANNGIPTRIDRQHSIFHNKTLVMDGRTVVTGSFNFTKAAQNNNAENVIVLRNYPEIARQYAANWQLHWDHSEAYPGVGK